MENKETNVWFVQCNPNNYDLSSAVVEFDYDLWKVRSNDKERVNARKLKDGDLCIFWESGKDAGFIGYGEVIKAAHLREIPSIFYKFDKKTSYKNSENLEEVIQLSYNLFFQGKIQHSTLKMNPEFKEDYLCGLSNFPPGTFFPVSGESWKLFKKIFKNNIFQKIDKIKYWFCGLSAPKECKTVDYIFEKMMNEGIYSLGWPGFTVDISNLSLDEVNSKLELTSLESSDKDCHRWIRFDMDLGDIVIAKKGDSPSKPQKRVYAIGVIISGYKYGKSLDPRTGSDSSHNIHFRDVEWVFNFYADYNKGISPYCFLELYDISEFNELFSMKTLTLPKEFELFAQLEDAILKKLEKLVNDKLVNNKLITTYVEKFRYLKLRAKFLKVIKAKIEEFNKNSELKVEINDLYKKLEDFKKQYPFKEDPNSINRLTADDIYIENDEERCKVGDFFHKIEFEMKGVGRYFTYSNTYLNIKNQLDDFKNLLRVVVDNKMTLAEKIDVNWEKIAGMGSDKQIAKKIVFCYNNEFLPIFKTEHLENFFIEIYGIDDFPTDYKTFSTGQKYQFLTEKLLSFKNSLDITKDWSNILFSTFLYQELDHEMNIAEIFKNNNISAKLDLSAEKENILNFLKKNMNIW